MSNNICDRLVLRFYTMCILSLVGGWMSNYADTVHLSYGWLLGWLLGMLLMTYGGLRRGRRVKKLRVD